MTVEVPQWVIVACQRWGRVKRRIWNGGDWYYNSAGARVKHVDGYADSFLARVKDERVAAGSGTALTQHWAEVYWGEALEVQRAIFGLPVHAFDTLHLHYVFDREFGLPTRKKARYCGLSVNDFWLTLAKAEGLLWRRLEPRESSKQQSIESVLKTCIFRPTFTSVVEFSLAPLNRPVLSRNRAS